MPEVPRKKVVFAGAEDFSNQVVTGLLSLGLPLGSAQILCAHIALSTGWGRSADNYRLAGIKATSESQDYTVNSTKERSRTTGEEFTIPREKFRAYKTLTDGLRAIIGLLSAKRYKASWAFLMNEDTSYFRQLGADGWYTGRPNVVHAGCMSRLKQIRQWTTPTDAGPLLLALALLTIGVL